MNAILSPSHRLPQVIGSGRKTVVSTWKIGKAPHLILFPNKPEIDKADGKGPGVEICAAPSLSERLRIGGLRDTHYNALSILDIPCDTAVWPPECAEVRERTVAPQSSVSALISRQPGVAGHPTLIIDTVSRVTGAAERGEARDLVLGFCLYCFRLLCMQRCQCRTVTHSDQNNEESLASSIDFELCCHVWSPLLNFHDDTLGT